MNDGLSNDTANVDATINTDGEPDVTQNGQSTDDSTPDDTNTSTDINNDDAQDVTSDAKSDSDDDEGDDKKDDSPEWFMKDKYKSIEEQAKSAYELQKKMGKFWGAPQDNYTVEGIEGLQKDDPLLENLMPALKEIGLSQDGFVQLVKQYQDANVNMMKKYEEQLKEELTVNDAQTYQAVDKWMMDNLTPEEREQVQNNWLMTPADFKLLNNLRLMAAPSTNVPSSANGESSRFESSKEVENDKIKYRREVNQGLRVPDKNYEGELAQRFRDARTRELRSKSS